MEMSIKDGLTGLCNRRYFMEALIKEVKRALRHKRDLSLLAGEKIRQRVADTKFVNFRNGDEISSQF